MKLPGLFLLLAWVAASGAAEAPRAEITAPPPVITWKPFTHDYYPPTSIVLGEQGVAKIRLCYDQRGRVRATTLAGSSGFKRLDDAALRMGKNYRIRPRIANGQPQEDCIVDSIKFSEQETKEPKDRGEVARPAPIPPTSVPPRLVPLSGEVDAARNNRMQRSGLA